MYANYPVSSVFSRFLVMSGMILATIAANAQPAHFLDSMKHLPPKEALPILKARFQKPDVPAFEKAAILLLEGKLLAELAQYDSALRYLSRSAQAFTNVKDSAGLGDSFYETGIVYALRARYKESIVAHQKAFVVYQKTHDHNSATKTLLSLGYSNFKLKKYPEAKQFYTQALERSQRNSSFEQMVEAYDGLANVYEAQKDYRKAIASVRLMQGAYDSIANRDHKQKLDDLEDKYFKQLEEKDQQLVIAEAQRQQLKTDRLLRLIERDDIQLTFYSVALALTFVSLCLLMAWLFTQRQAKIVERKLRSEQANTKTANEQFDIISRQIHDELTGSLNDISFSTSQLTTLKSREELAEAAMNVKDVGQSLIGNMMNMVWLMNPNNRSLESLIAYIKDRANEFLTRSGINYMIVVPDKIPSAQLASLERVNLFSVTLELIRYVVNRSKATGLTLSVALEGRQMIFKVKDNSTPVDEIAVRKRSEDLKPLRDKMEQVDGTIGIVLEQGAMVVIYRKDLK
jgi:two-component system NarL family sensor kinase